MLTERRICFVIMPFSQTTEQHTESYWTQHFESFLKPIIEENPELEARRSQALRGDILREIITSLVVSPVVVADLTDYNPNVYWELGVRQSFKHGTVTVAEAETTLPFDIGAKGTLFYYPRNHLKYQDFRMRFKEAIKDCLVNPDRPDSHVLETLSGRGTLFEIFRKDEVIRRLDAVLSECDRNLDTLEDVITQAQNNQKDPTKCAFITQRLCTSAIVLLITNRYVDEDPKFFKSAEVCWSFIVPINDQLRVWEYSPSVVDKWLLRSADTLRRLLTNFKTNVVSTHKKLIQRL